MKDSTRRVFRMHGWRIDRALHNWLYFVFYDRYVAVFLAFGRLAVRWFGWVPVLSIAFRAVFDRYHAKVLTRDDVEKILALRGDFFGDPDIATRVVPYPYANKVLFADPDWIAVMDCPCRLSRDEHCEPVRVCIAVGRTTAQFWLEHGAKFHVERITPENALSIIRGARARGNITTAWFKVATGGRTGVLCSCCSCCCGGLEAMRLARKTAGGKAVSNLVPSGYLARFDEDACRGCGTCEHVCMFHAMSRTAEGKRSYDAAACMGCGLCVEHCTGKAIRLEHDPAKGTPLDLDLLRTTGAVNQQPVWTGGGR